MNSTQDISPRSRRQILLLTVVAFGLGLLLVVAVILPAEYSLDPLGTGKALGVLGLAADGSTAVVTQNDVHKTDVARFQLAPFESVEYSYRMELGAVLIYSWQASGELVFNLHSTPDLPGSDSPDYAESFANGRSVRGQGTFTAPFAGQHGWFWENRSNEEVTLELATAGFVGDSLQSAVGSQQTGSPQPALDR